MSPSGCLSGVHPRTQSWQPPKRTFREIVWCFISTSRETTHPYRRWARSTPTSAEESTCSGLQLLHTLPTGIPGMGEPLPQSAESDTSHQARHSGNARGGLTLCGPCDSVVPEKGVNNHAFVKLPKSNMFCWCKECLAMLSNHGVLCRLKKGYSLNSFFLTLSATRHVIPPFASVSSSYEVVPPPLAQCFTPSHCFRYRYGLVVSSPPAT
jgi:hypothetical protein